MLFSDTFGPTPNYDALATIGWISPVYNNISGSLSYGTFTEPMQVYQEPIQNDTLLIPPSTTVYCNVSIPETGSAFTGQVILTGVYV